jgi:hypothetical protein
MGCDYYTQSELVIEYMDEKGSICKTITNRVLERGYIWDVPDVDSDDDCQTQSKKYDEYIEKIINEHTYKKMLYENEQWIKSSYEKKYRKDLYIICPRIIKLIKVYKVYTAWKRE